MKIRQLTPDNFIKVSALLRQAFPGNNYEVQLFKNLHENGRPLHEWVCIQNNKIIAYIAFSNAFFGTEICGLHLAPLAVKPQMQNRGIGSELLRFALRQDPLNKNTLFVLGAPDFYQKFGFKQCTTPTCPFAKNSGHFLSIRNNISQQYTLGYEPEFSIGA